MHAGHACGEPPRIFPTLRFPLRNKRITNGSATSKDGQKVSCNEREAQFWVDRGTGMTAIMPTGSTLRPSPFLGGIDGPSADGKEINGRAAERPPARAAKEDGL